MYNVPRGSESQTRHGATTRHDARQPRHCAAPPSSTPRAAGSCATDFPGRPSPASRQTPASLKRRCTRPSGTRSRSCGRFATRRSPAKGRCTPNGDRTGCRRASATRAIVRGWGVLTMEVAPRVAPVLLLVRDAAASDAELARLQEEMDASRLTRMTQNARTLLRGGHLRDGITLDAAADVLWTYSSPELITSCWSSGGAGPSNGTDDSSPTR